MQISQSGAAAGQMAHPSYSTWGLWKLTVELYVADELDDEFDEDAILWRVVAERDGVNDYVDLRGNV